MKNVIDYNYDYIMTNFSDNFIRPFDYNEDLLNLINSKFLLYF